jgi:hypothetical protein
VFVLAGRPIGAATGAELDAALVEVLVEVGPFLRGGLAVFVGRAFGASSGEELLVGVDDVFAGLLCRPSSRDAPQTVHQSQT